MNDYYGFFAQLYDKYYADMPAYERRARAARCALHLQLVARNVTAPRPRVCDIGGLFGDFASGCASLGMDASFVDDFQNPCHADLNDPRRGIHLEYGVQAIQRDVISEGLDLPAESFDAFTCFATMEHWHHSPKALFAQIKQALKPGGLFVLSAPNCVDLYRRITVPLGVGGWTRMSEWYEQPVFRGHVREPSLSDLRYVARDMGLREVQLFGRNWNLYLSRNRLVRLAAPALDRTLRLAPGVCLAIYMMGRK